MLAGLNTCLAFAQTMQVHHTDGTLTSISTNVINSVDFVSDVENYGGSERIAIVPYTTIHPVIQGQVIKAKINSNPVEIQLTNVADRLFYYKGEDGTSHYCEAGDLIDPDDHTIHIQIPHDYIFGWDTSANYYFLEKSDSFYARKAHINDYIPLYYNWTTGGYGALYDYVNETLQNSKLNALTNQEGSEISMNYLPTEWNAIVSGNATIHSCNRCGYTLNGAPFQSLYAFVDAYKQGFDMLLCDLQFTSDNVPVLEHDYYLNQYYPGVTTMEGQPLPSTEEKKIYIANTSYEELLKYDFSRGSTQYSKVPICTFADYLKLIKQLGVTGIIELKTRITEDQTRQVCHMVKQYGLADHVWWAGDDGEQLQYFNKYLSQCHLLLATPSFESVFQDFLKLKTDKNQLAVRFPFSGTDNIAKEPNLEDYIDTFIDNDILVQIGTVNSSDIIDQWFEKGPLANYVWCVRSDKLVASGYLRNKMLGIVKQ